jgi:serine/threonine-protein kinase
VAVEAQMRDEQETHTLRSLNQNCESASDTIRKDGACVVPDFPASWGPFRLLSRLGRGGFGEIFLAWDPALQREVALKLLLPEVVRTEASSILSEARLLARVRHPNIVSVFGVDQHDGRIGFWSDFVRGKTLAQLLELQGPFSAPETAHIAIEIGRGIAAVHAAGLLHRDIKPANVMREDGGRILLMDFGLTHERGGAQAWGGTPPYMAPELLAGNPATVATDIYAFGVTLFHLMTGKYPIDQHKVLKLPPEQPGSRRRLMDERPDLPEQLARAVEKAIDPEPHNRYGSVGEMLGEISDWLAVSVPRSGGDPGPVRLSDRKRLYLATAIVAIFATGLYFKSDIRNLLESDAAHPAGGAAHTIYVAAQDLLDRYYKPDNLDKAVVLFRQALGRNPDFALAHAGLGRAYFQQYRDGGDAKLLAASQAACMSALENDSKLASAHVTLGMVYTQTGKNDLALQELNEAIRLDSTNAEAQGALAELYAKLGRKAEVEPTFRKAADLAPSDWRWPYMLGLYYLTAGDVDEAVVQFREAVRMTPDNPRAYNNLGIAYRRQNRLGEARKSYEEAIRLEPTFNRLSNLGRLLQEEGNLEDAASMYKRAIDMNPGSYATWGNLGSVYLRMREPVKAREAYLKAISVGEAVRNDRPKDAVLLGGLGVYYAAVGDAENGIRALRQATALAPSHPEVLYRAAEGYELLHRREEALQWMERALKAGLPRLAVERNPELAALRSDPRFLNFVSPP